MATPVPAHEATQLYNDYVDADEDLERIAVLEWRAMKLVRQQPRSFSARVSYGAILLDLAKRAEALAEFAVADRLCDMSDSTAMNVLAVGYAKAGDYKKAIEICRRLLSNSQLSLRISVAKNATIAATLSGDKVTLQFLADLDAEAGAIAKDNIAVLENNGLWAHFSNHQQIVLDAIGELQCKGTVSTFGEEDEMRALVCEYQILGNKQTRKALDRKIFDRLEDYYSSQGLSPGYYIGRLTTVLIPVSEYRQGEQAA